MIESKSDNSGPLSESQSGRGIVGVVILTVLHAAIWLAMLLGLRLFVPICREMFEEFGLPLPAIAQLVMAASNAVAGYWYLFIPAILLGLTIEFLVLLMAGHEKKLLAAALFTLVPLLLAGLGILGVLLPLADLVSSLRQ